MIFKYIDYYSFIYYSNYLSLLDQQVDTDKQQIQAKIIRYNYSAIIEKQSTQ